MKFYNSLTNSIEEFKPLNAKEIKMYVCGSTVYNDMHIGNSRPIICFDVLSRFFKYIGYDVKYVSNFTDIDDKIINKAKEENVSEEVISERYIASILDTYQKLNCLPHFKNPKVTENMSEIIDFIKLLIEKKAAYIIDGDVYFDVTKARDYGVLSGQVIDNLMVGARIDENDKKTNPGDFNLWKSTNSGKQWSSPWSEGRPGWHTECVVMINNIFHQKIDIHGGGVDIKFPHHDNEIAQATVAFDHKIASFWMHVGRIDLNGVKMSKSLGNVIMAKELVQKIGYGPYRLLILNVPYRQPLNYRDELLKQAQTDYEKIISAKRNLIRRLQIEFSIIEYQEQLFNEEILAIKKEFIDALSHDFNTANAITSIIKITKLVNNITRQKDLIISYAGELLTLLDEMLWVLGIDQEIEPLNEEDLQLVKKWQNARINKQFDLADKYRQIMINKGINM